MTTATIIDFPQALRERFGDTVSFSTITGIYWDGMDWCQYDEVLSTPEDRKILEQKYEEGDFVDAHTFFAK